ncbi:MAG: phage terminase large subunit family protein, partial [Dehalococcoidia bacterium]
YLYFRGSDSSRQVASVDADAVYLDEFDTMDPGVLALALQRLGSSQRGIVRIASTPRYPEAGINELFLQSDQMRYFLPCPSCDRFQTLEWPANIDFEQAAIVCSRASCRARMNLWAEGQWRPTAPENTLYRGYHLSRLYSPMASVEMMIREAEAATIYEEQQFQNQVLGEVYLPKGGGLSQADLDQCRRDYFLNEYTDEETFMGVDVGKKLHVVIRIKDEHYRDQSGRLVFADEVDEFDDLGPLMTRFDVATCVVDSQPEGHLATKFANAFPLQVWLAMYNRQQSGHDRVPMAGGRPNFLHVNRTEALDELTHRYKKGLISLPQNARKLGGRIKDGEGDYYRHLLASRRAIEPDGNGNFHARWLHGSKPDHYAHAETYCLLASTAAYVSHRIYPAW